MIAHPQPTPDEIAAIRAELTALANYAEVAGWICTPYGNIPEVLRHASTLLAAVDQQATLRTAVEAFLAIRMKGQGA